MKGDKQDLILTGILVAAVIFQASFIGVVIWGIIKLVGYFTGGGAE